MSLQTSKVSSCSRVGNKKNGAVIFNGTKVFKAWSCLSPFLSLAGKLMSTPVA